MDFMHISGEKEAIWNTLFSILSDGGALQTSRGPGKLPPPFPPLSTGLHAAPSKFYNSEGSFTHKYLTAIAGW